MAGIAAFGTAWKIDKYKDNLQVRKAMALALDRNAFNTILAEGKSSLGAVMLPSAARLSTLAQVLAWADHHECRLNVELKHEGDDPTNLVRAVAARPIADSVVVNHEGDHSPRLPALVRQSPRFLVTPALR